MGERATVFNGVQIGPEAVAGTAVVTPRMLASFDIQPSIKGDGTVFRPLGQKFATTVTPGREWTEAKLTGNPTFGELAYILASLFKKATPTNDGATAKLWNFNITPSGEDDPQTYTVEAGSNHRVMRFSYGLINSGTFTFKRDGFSFDGGMLGQAIEDDVPFSTNASFTLTTGAAELTAGTYTLTVGGQTTATIQYNATLAQIKAAIEALSNVGAGNVKVTGLDDVEDLTAAGSVVRVEFINAKASTALVCSGTFTSLTPSAGVTLATLHPGQAVSYAETSPVPVPGKGITVTLADTWAGLATAGVTLKPIRTVLAIQDRWSAFWYMDASQESFGNHVERAPNSTIKILAEADAAGMKLLNTLRAGSQKCIRIKCDGPAIATGYNYLFQVDMVGLIPPSGGISDFSDEDGVYAAEWTFQTAKDASNNTISALLRNALGAL